ncbi:MAG: S41 family peptidase [Treponema sp.]|jgi:carboxyl-terminal processing protease|nr:S41 family peptidase [Treponema sp.]
MDKKKTVRALVWVGAICAICAAFILTSVPAAFAQSRGGKAENDRYAGLIRDVMAFIEQHYVDEVDAHKLYEGAMTGMFNALGDPYSVYMPAEDMTDLSDTTQGSFGGVGLYITKPVGPRADGAPNYLEVASPIEDTPGWRSGINPGDLILEINGESTAQLSSDECVSRLRGKPGTDVQVLIRRGEKLEFPVTLTRAIIEVPTAKHAMIGKTGYLKLLTFTPMTVSRAREAIADFKKEGYTSLILDLRNNYGGLLDSAVGISQLFLDGGTVVSTKSRTPRENRVYPARGVPIVDKDMPVIVLINRGSASASEIVAGALKDRGRALLVGEKSYGKGSVQQVFPLDSDGSGYKITVSRYYTPSDVNIDKIGIPPDREVSFPEFTEKDTKALNDLLNADLIAPFVASHPQAGRAETDAFAAELARQFPLDAALIRRLIRNEQNRKVIAPVYDLEYDVQLKAAVDIFNIGEWSVLMRTSKTLKQLQEEAEAELEEAA